MTDHNDITIKYRCQNGVDFDECDEIVNKKGEMCDTCESIAYDLASEAAASDYFGGSANYTQKEKSDAIFKELIELGVREMRY